MARAPDYFSDLLAPGEAVTGSIGGPGPSAHQKAGEHLVWHQLAFTATRLLVVRLVRSPMGTTFEPANRYAVDKRFLRIARFPRTPASTARLRILGAGDPIEVLDVDLPAIFPQVEPFLAAWGGVVEGGGVLVPAEDDPYAAAKSDTRTLFIVMGVCVLLLVLCCGCSSLIWGIRAYLA